MSGWRIRPQMDEIDLDASYGEFTKLPGRKYIKRQHNFVDLIDNDLFFVHNIDDMMQVLGCVEEGKIMYYHFKRPIGNLDFGLFALGSDQEVNHLRSYVASHKLIEVYKEFRNQNMEPLIVETFCEALGGFSDSQGSGDSSDSDDSDFIVDEDKLLNDPKVEMHDFYLNINDNLEWVGDTPITIENVVMSDAEMEVINTNVLQSESSSDEGKMSKRRNKIWAAKRAQINDADQVSDPFYILQTFSSSHEAKDRIYLHAIETRRELDIVKNDKTGSGGKGGPSQSNMNGGPSQSCEKGGPSKCSGKGGSSKKKSVVKVDESNQHPWELLVCKWKKDGDWTVKTYEKEHKCLQTRKIKDCIYKFLSKQILEQLESNPEIPIRALKEQLERKYQIQISDMKVFRAKEKAQETIRGDFGGQYSIFWDYLLEVQTRNPNTTVKLQCKNSSNPASDTRTFRCVDFLGLDGAFMKGPYPDMILTAVGLDGNNCTYPVAYGVVEFENYSSWTWFLKNLGDDLDLTTNSNFTFITNRKKGCFACNCKIKCATMSTVQQFNLAMEEVNKLNNDAYELLKAIPLQHWSRSHFTGRAQCDALLNNLCETLNSKLDKGRDSPIISCLEFIREYIMKKIFIDQNTIDKWYGPLTLTATKTLEKIKGEATEYRAVFCGNRKYQVTSCEGMDQCVVDIAQHTCSCNMWEKHTIAAIWDMRRNNENVGIPKTWVHSTYCLKTWQDMYAFNIEPINGRMMWEKIPCPTKLIPPKHHALIDDSARGTRTIRCLNCGNVGHNGRSCKGRQLEDHMPVLVMWDRMLVWDRTQVRFIKMTSDEAADGSLTADACRLR
uniref:CCHC-type domain-containing protein n=1 Tax=Lactuca sativa TaxID=4236 RepID=A0A9R1V835_LACSA|nr:hypothetical protein LSAT_V11C600329930 [Lactuca sativa]